MNKKIAVVCYKYSIEISPTAKNLCVYLTSKQKCNVDVFIDRLYRTDKFHIDDCKIINFDINKNAEQDCFGIFNLFGSNRVNKRDYFGIWYVVTFVKRFITKIHNYISTLLPPESDDLFISSLSKYCTDYDIYFAIDIPSLTALKKCGVKPNQVIFWSFESIDYLRSLEKDEKDSILQYLNKCKCRIIQSAGRAKDMNMFFNSKLNFIYIPVSYRGSTNVIKHKIKKSKIKIVYSGYLAQWSGIEELLKIIKDLNLNIELVLHGHSMTTKVYVDKLRKLVNKIDYAKINLTFYSEEDYDIFLAQFDIGLALYLNLRQSPNFENLIFSSGKIAAYLKNNLAIITNIDHEITKSAPFIYLPNNFKANDFVNAINKYKDNIHKYNKASQAVYRKYYDFDFHMKKLEEFIC